MNKFFGASWLIVVLSSTWQVGCVRHRVQISVPPASPSAPVPAPQDSSSTPLAASTPPVSLPPQDTLAEARTWVRDGNYVKAVTEYSRILSDSPEPQLAQVALLQLAILYASSNNPEKDLDKSQSYLNKLVSEHPSSALLPEARTLLGMIKELSDTTRDLNQTKETNRLQDRTIKKLQTDLEKVQAELQRLKAIDLKAKNAK